MSRHFRGLVLITLSAGAYSLAGFFTRLISLDAWTMLFWRGLFAGVFIAGFILYRERRNALPAIRAIGRPGAAAALLSTLATIMFLNAFRRTSVADVMVIAATIPFFTAAIGWIWLREKESWSTLAASLGALLGVSVMVGGAIGQGHLVGDLLAFGMTLCMAMMLLIIRRHRDVSMLPAACLSALLCPLFVWPVAAPLGVTLTELLFLVLFGTVQFGLGLVFLTLGGQLVTATENALVSTLETPMAVLWVWLAFQEIPPTPSVLGGLIVMAAVAAHVCWTTTAAGTRTRPHQRNAA
jgi:drug/metabolite transporter (DMT)-like permease